MKIEQYPEVPVVYPGLFPANFNPNTDGWGNFPKSVIECEQGKLMMLDLDFGRACSLDCPHCFRKSESWTTGEPDLSYAEIINVIEQALPLGLRAVKFLGAGEPFEDSRVVPFLRYLDSKGVASCVFTSGNVLGDDVKASKYHGYLGISSADELISVLYPLNCSLIVKFNSADYELQQRLTGKIASYTDMRNHAIELLAKAGFNRLRPTRLGLGTSPITIDNIDEAFKMYQWAMRRNMFAVICPTMITGRCGNDQWLEINPVECELIDLYVRIYRWNIKNEIMTLDQIRSEGISAYAGVRPCNQVGCGLYVTLDGTVRVCPSNEKDNLGNVHYQSLSNIWQSSPNLRLRSGQYNCGCPSKMGQSFPDNFFSTVLRRLESNL